MTGKHAGSRNSGCSWAMHGTHFCMGATDVEPAHLSVPWDWGSHQYPATGLRGPCRAPWKDERPWDRKQLLTHPMHITRSASACSEKSPSVQHNPTSLGCLVVCCLMHHPGSTRK